jgi:hypothetical protein
VRACDKTEKHEFNLKQNDKLELLLKQQSTIMSGIPLTVDVAKHLLRFCESVEVKTNPFLFDGRKGKNTKEAKILELISVFKKGNDESEEPNLNVSLLPSEKVSKAMKTIFIDIPDYLRISTGDIPNNFVTAQLKVKHQLNNSSRSKLAKKTIEDEELELTNYAMPILRKIAAITDEYRKRQTEKSITSKVLSTTTKALEENVGDQMIARSIHTNPSYLCINDEEEDDEDEVESQVDEQEGGIMLKGTAFAALDESEETEN